MEAPCLIVSGLTCETVLYRKRAEVTDVAAERIVVARIDNDAARTHHRSDRAQVVSDIRLECQSRSAMGAGSGRVRELRRCRSWRVTRREGRDAGAAD